MQTLKEFMLKPWLYLIIVITSLVLKVLTVDHRFFWRDEIYTIHHTAGHTEFTLNETAPINEIKNITYYNKVLSLNERDLAVSSQINGLIRMTNLNPIHYYFLIIWHRLIGDDDVHYRFFSIFMFLLCLPAFFLLAKRLFNSNLAGWITISLFALSPFFHHFALEARYNMLLIFILISSHYLLLKAIDYDNLKYWIGYTCLGVLALYASLTAGIVLFGHFIYVLIYKKKHLKAYISSGVIILLCYLPWIFSIINNRIEISESLAWQYENNPDRVNLIWVMFFQLLHLGLNIAQFVDNAEWVSFFFSGRLQTKIILQVIADLIVLFVLLFSIITASRNLPKDKFGFLVFITLPLLLFFLIVDIIRGSFTAAMNRYQMAVYIGTIIFIAWLLYRKIVKMKLNFTLLYLVFFVFGIISLAKIAAQEKGHTNTGMRNINTANFISRAASPLIITNGNTPHFFWGEFLSVLNACESESIDILYADENIKNVEEMISGKRYSNIYILMVSNTLKDNLKSQFKNKMIKVNNDNIKETWELKLSSY
jgi:uncharacterized membrane protein